jgi:hypothetical protein
MHGDKKPYEPPSIQSESAFEILTAGCGFMDPFSGGTCDPSIGGMQFGSP